MNYCYDIIINLDETLYYFYEWEENDLIEHVKKVPVIKINSNKLKEIASNKIILEDEIINNIINETSIYNTLTTCNCLVLSDTYNSLVLEFNNKGEEINISSLLIEDELNINEQVYSFNNYNLKYKIKEKRKRINNTKNDEYIKKIILTEIEYLYKNKQEDKLIFLYKEWFNKTNSLRKMYQDMINDLDIIDNKHYKIYDLILLSYKIIK
jgi:hypothetical protein